MSFLFGGGVETTRAKKNPIRDMQAHLRQSMRTLQRDAFKSKEQEKQLMTDIKICARANRFELCAIKAKALVRLRSHQSRVQNTVLQLSSMEQSLGTVSATQVMQDTVKNTCKLLEKMNLQMNAAGIMKLMREYQQQSEEFSTKQEAIHESIDSAMETEDEESVTDATVADVYTELGLDTSLLMSKRPAAEAGMVQQLQALSVPTSLGAH